MGMLGFGLLGFLFAAITIGVLVWAIVDILKRPWKNDANKIIWLLLVIFLGLIGIIVYAILRNTEAVELIKNNKNDNLPR
jgi:predicted PurR-regulated permease PerM